MKENHLKMTKKKNGCNPEQLDKALNQVEEMFDRCVCPFFLFGETLRSVCEDEQVKGDKIELGVLKKHLTPEVKVTFTSPDFSTHLENFKISNDKIEYMVEGVPIEIKIVHRKYGCLENPDKLLYKFADFTIPNPLKSYYKIRGIIK